MVEKSLLIGHLLLHAIRRAQLRCKSYHGIWHMKCWILQILPVWKLNWKETQQNDPFPSFPLASLLEVVSTSVEPCGLEEQREADRWGFTCPEKIQAVVFFFFSSLQARWWYWHLMRGWILSFSLVLWEELLDESSSQALQCTSGQAPCVPPLNYGSSHPQWVTISRSAFLLKSAAWKDLMLRSKLLRFRCSSSKKQIEYSYLK